MLNTILAWAIMAPSIFAFSIIIILIFRALWRWAKGV